MFTGIVEEVGRVRSQAGKDLVVEAGVTLEGVQVGDSIAVNGACLTITGLEANAFSVDLSPETVSRTNLGILTAGVPVNLERPLAYGGRLGGHLVQGHVDGTATVASITPTDGSYLFIFEAPAHLMRYVVEKGFVAVDGISLTAVESRPTAFSVAVIPYTYEHTVLGSIVQGDIVNIETDILAKYVERLLQSEAGHESLEKMG